MDPIYWVSEDDTICGDCLEEHEREEATPMLESNGAQSDSPVHCARCGTFTENPLTEEGVAYVADALEAHERGRGRAEILTQWAGTYAQALRAHPNVDALLDSGEGAGDLEEDPEKEAALVRAICDESAAGLGGLRTTLRIVASPDIAEWLAGKGREHVSTCHAGNVDSMLRLAGLECAKRGEAQRMNDTVRVRLEPFKGRVVEHTTSDRALRARGTTRGEREAALLNEMKDALADLAQRCMNELDVRVVVDGLDALAVSEAHVVGSRVGTEIGEWVRRNARETLWETLASEVRMGLEVEACRQLSAPLVRVDARTLSFDIPLDDAHNAHCTLPREMLEMMGPATAKACVGSALGDAVAQAARAISAAREKPRLRVCTGKALEALEDRSPRAVGEALEEAMEGIVAWGLAEAGRAWAGQGEETHSRCG